MLDGWKRFQVVGKDGKKHFFEPKVAAKKFRDGPDAAKGAVVSFGPDHPKHKLNRREHGWNKGRHPRSGWQGKSKKAA